MEYSLAAGVRAKADRLRLRLGGWSDRDLTAMLAISRGVSEDNDVRNERIRVERAMARAIGGGGGGRGGSGSGSRQGAGDTVLIRGLTKVCTLHLRRCLCLVCGVRVRWLAEGGKFPPGVAVCSSSGAFGTL